MSIRRVGGGRVIDEGPSSASATGLRAVASLEIPGIRSAPIDGGAGPVERRRATEDELIASRAREVQTSPIAPVRAPQLSPPEDPVMPIQPLPAFEEAEPDPKLQKVAEAAQLASLAFSAHQAAERAWNECRRALMEAWRSLGLETDDELVDHAWQRLGLDDQDAADPGTTETRAPANGEGPGPMPPYQRRIVDALIESNGDRQEAARRLGIKTVSLTGSLSGIRRRTDLTAEERAAITSRRRADG